MRPGADRHTHLPDPPTTGVTYPHRVSAGSNPSTRQSPLRVKIEHLSDPVLRHVARLPKVVPALVVLALLVLGALLRQVAGAICFAVCALLVGWLLYLSWPRLSPPERMMRGAVVLLLAAVTVVTAAS